MLSKAGRLAMVHQDRREQILVEVDQPPHEPVKRIMRRILAATATKSDVVKHPRNKKIEICCGDCVTLMKKKITNESISVVKASLREVAERYKKLAGIKSGMTVLDPFCGIGGMDAAPKPGVEGIGIDIDPEYCKTAIGRIQQGFKCY